MKTLIWKQTKTNKTSATSSDPDPDPEVNNETNPYSNPDLNPDPNPDPNPNPNPDRNPDPWQLTCSFVFRPVERVMASVQFGAIISGIRIGGILFLLLAGMSQFRFSPSGIHLFWEKWNSEDFLLLD